MRNEIFAQQTRWDEAQAMLTNSHFTPDNPFWEAVFPHPRFQIAHVVPFEKERQFPRYQKGLPDPVALEGGKIGWKAGEFLDYVLSLGVVTSMLKSPLYRFIENMSDRFYRDYSAEKAKLESPGITVKPRVAEIQGSISYGSAFDPLYKNIGHSIGVVSQGDTNTYSNGKLDVDLAFVTFAQSSDLPNLLDTWDDLRRDVVQNGMPVNSNGMREYLSIRHHMIEHKSVHGETIYKGWQLIEETTDDDTHIATLHAGLFTFDKEATISDSFIPLNKLVTFHLSSLPVVGHIPNHNRRTGVYGNFVDTLVALELKKSIPEGNTSGISNGQLYVTERDWNGISHVKYGRVMLRLFLYTNFEEYPMVMFESNIRGVKQMAAQVGVFDIPYHYARMNEKNMTPNIWKEVDVDYWSNYLINNLFGSAHLSPLVLGTMMVDNSRLDALPMHLQSKLAAHGIDSSLSLGKLFGISLTPEQVEVFLNTLPHQANYENNYISDPEKQEHQGLWHLVRALELAGVEFPDFEGNLLKKAAWLFRHPADTRWREEGELLVLPLPVTTEDQYATVDH